MFELVLGGVRSGKSKFALSLLKKEGRRGLIVTAKSLDFNFKRQILQHRKERDKDILVFESGHDLGARIANLPLDLDSLLIEGLDFWFFSIVKLKNKEQILSSFWKNLKNRREHVVLVSSEMSLGFLPVNIDIELVRECGEFNQKLAQLCSKVYLVVAGCPVILKDKEDKENGLF
ncbi:adenosylcobinamide kinase /adenosylcobinamide-phosphate guanylyltransferase [Desulfonauticus submarinus]|uniref:Adenosylcobinamide kinase n=1 Tax=Desulfonauticus submarinus TaxID=206665 RepID=A0A1H0EMB2_9BACT|nr:bifunctional adenosylcobinamide kinase/adenosylcobinamide-phosphate guanylyltransferase [Desulfonauticus submarinus]SDN83463.1 adenosylcobinamide kinase /adenosylcobinamide-phosphate guanylyltransferase [Desulfonauticus submarinus]